MQLTVSDSIDEHMEEVKQRKQLKIDTFSNENGLRELSQREVMSLFGEVEEDEEGNLRIAVDDAEEVDGEGMDDEDD